MSKNVEKTEVVTNPIPDAPAEQPIPVIKYGTVNLPKEFKALNVRAEAKNNAAVLCTVDNKAKLEVEKVKEAPNWVKVKTKDGVVDYCVKKYITLK